MALTLGCVMLVVLAVSIVVHSRNEPEVVSLEARLAPGAEPGTVEPRVTVVRGEPERVAVSVPPKPVVTNAVIGSAAANATPKAVATNSAPAVTVAVPARRQVRMANRTLELAEGTRKFPKKFAELQSPSGRKTVPYVVVAEEPVSSAMRRRASACGARVIGFMPVNSLIVEAGEKALRRLERETCFAAAYELAPTDKIQSSVREVAAKTPAKVDVTVVPLMVTDVALLAEFVKAQGGMVIPADDERPVLRARVPATAVDALSRRGDVRWIERYVPATLQNDVAVNADHHLMNVREVWDVHGLTGEGQNLVVSDSGVDTGDLNTIMADFTGRVYRVKQASFGMQLRDVVGHGTHVAGSLVGNGSLSNGRIKGVAYGARLYAWQCVDRYGYLYPPTWSKMFQPDERGFPSFIHSASWAYEETEASYIEDCNEIDDYVWRHPTTLPVFAAGNSDGYSAAMTVLVPSTAKNVISVGATESWRPTSQWGVLADSPLQMAYLSRQGPTKDGRIKPDVCAPGTMILSTLSTQCGTNDFGWGRCAENTNYVYNGGTSMATPLVAGAAALTREWLVKRRGFTNAVPTAALVKAVLLGGARDMSKFAGADCGGAAPNGRQGWGSVNLGETLYPSNRSVKLVDSIPFATGAERVVRVMTTNAAPLDVQLVWIDHPGDPSAASALVNDLDLVVSNETTGTTWWGNGVAGGDRKDNVEGVRIAQADAGVYAIRVVGAKVPYDSAEGGAAALYVRGALAASTRDEDATRAGEGWHCLRRRTRFPHIQGWGRETESWYPSGTVVRVEVPSSLPDGAERLQEYALNGGGGGDSATLGPQRLAEVRVVGDGTEEVRRDSAGRMALRFDVVMDGDREVWFDYYDEAAMETGVGLPTWWWRRYLAAEPVATAAMDSDGDGVSNGAEYAADTDPADAGSAFRILEFSPTNIVWSGGHVRTQVVERSRKLGPVASWTGVCTKLPPTDATNSFHIHSEGSSNYFYRIRAF